MGGSRKPDRPTAADQSNVGGTHGPITSHDKVQISITAMGDNWAYFLRTISAMLTSEAELSTNGMRDPSYEDVSLLHRAISSKKSRTDTRGEEIISRANSSTSKLTFKLRTSCPPLTS